MLASPLVYLGQLTKEDHELRLAHPFGHSELRFIHLCSSLIILYPDFNTSHIKYKGLFAKGCVILLMEKYRKCSVK